MVRSKLASFLKSIKEKRGINPGNYPVMTKRIAIFASGTGSNAKKIIEHFKHNEDIAVKLLISNKPDAPVLDVARANDIPAFVIHRQDFYQSENILKIFNEYIIDFVVLAGFLWLVPGYLVQAFNRRMVNIHPALLPKFGGKGMFGMNVHQAVHEAGEEETGITIHFVNEQYDDGAVVFQAQCAIEPGDSPETIAKKVLKLEHEHFPKVIEKLVTGL
jgi:phosphoribosylglycinamide formyltransferase-1